MLATASATTVATTKNVAAPIASQAQTDILEGSSAFCPVVLSLFGLFDDPKPVGFGPKALGTAIVPFHEDLTVVGVKDRPTRANAEVLSEKLDPVTFAR
jgi:hypothetical protein